MRRTVIKLGGSLLDVPGLGEQLRAYVASLKVAQALVVVGGGSAADAVRQQHRQGRLTTEQAHWLAIGAMSENARRVGAMLDAPMLWSWAAVQEQSLPRTVLLDAYALLREDELHGGDPLPRSWDVTSDSIAARLAHDLDAGSLILLKSRAPDSDCTLEQAARDGVVDAHLPTVAGGLDVMLVNFRQEPPRVCCRWRPGHARAVRDGEH